MINTKIITLAEKIFSPNNAKKVELNLEADLLTVRVFKKKDINGWFSIVEIKRFYEKCVNENLLKFRFSWELTSLDLDDCNFIEIKFHLIKY
ncbi:hypothetical protein C8D70_12517 [Chryseobacterium sp. CBTAP 102]|uniref:hypothetical protein n=1 Tax=Chryseobacterium sp. CBTAP 102 TaxID=2135644 RepID=UPI000D7723A2|nr:hypothetical protein [Chryseobacterium sp. CBTAP 102]PXW06485.1 hypothetical protein C8D70_12517 [Chryseobacterium sp. CBTAP 102]